MGCSSSDIFLIKAETYANSGDFGLQCFNLNAGTFLNRDWISSRIKLCMGDDIGGIFDQTKGSCNSQRKDVYDIEVNQYGQLVNKQIFYSMKSQHYISNGGVYEGCIPEGGVYNMSYEDTIENGIVVKNTSTCQSQEGWPPGCMETNSSCAYSINTDCFTFGDSPTDCTTYSFEYNHPNCDDAYDGFENIKSLGLLTTPVNYGLLFPFTIEGANKKIEILQNNLAQNSQGLNCGPNVNDCYGFPAPNVGFSFDTLTSPSGSNIANIVTQKWRVKVAKPEDILKNILSQGYQLYSYYYTGENPNTDITPCCNSGDFGGVIFKQAQITLTYNNSPSNKKGEYILSSDHMEFDNFEYSGPSRNLYYCSKRI